MNNISEKQHVKLMQDEKFANIVKIYQSLTDLRKERFYKYLTLIVTGMGLDVDKILGR